MVATAPGNGLARACVVSRAGVVRRQGRGLQRLPSRELTAQAPSRFVFRAEPPARVTVVPSRVRCNGLADAQRTAGSTVLRRTVLAALAVLAVSHGIWVTIRPDGPGDLPVYEEYASILLAGNVPYRDFFMEYPPGALPVFVAPAFIFGDARDAAWTPADDAGRRYRRAFDSLVLLLTAAMVVLEQALSLAGRLCGDHCEPRCSPLAVVALWPLLIGASSTRDTTSGRRR